MEGEQNNVPVGSNGSSVGPIIGVIIILALVVLGGLYFWKERASGPVVEDIEETQTVRENDDTASIEEDLDSTNVEIIDVEVNAS